MIVSKALRAIMETAKETDEYWMDSAKLDFAIAIEAKRRDAGKSYADLARAMNTSNAYITKVFRGDANLTIESMTKLARAVGCNIDIALHHASAKEAHSRHVKKNRLDKAAGITEEYILTVTTPLSANDSSYFRAA